MGRFTTTVESAAGLVAGTPSGGTANGLFANLAASAISGYKLRRITFGVRAGAGAPSSQNLTIALVRVTARGTATTTNAPNALDPNLLQTSSLSGLDVAWSAVPTATWTAPYFIEWSFNDQGGGDMPYELLEELICPMGAGKGIAFMNVGNALPANHLLTMTVEHEE